MSPFIFLIGLMRVCNVPTLLQSLVLTSLDPWWAPRIASWVYQSIWRKLSWYHPVQPPCSFVLRLKVPEKGSHHLSVMSELLLSTGTENTKVKKKMKSELMPQLLLLIYTFLIEIYFFHHHGKFYYYFLLFFGRISCKTNWFPTTHKKSEIHSPILLRKWSWL